jgi:hypothetical protein
MPELERPPPMPGQPAPAARPGGAAWYRRRSVAAIVGLVVGLAFGTGLGLLLAGGDGGTDAADPGLVVPTTTGEPATTTTTGSLSQPCVETVRSAEQVLSLLQEGFQALRQAQLSDVQPALDEIQGLRQEFAADLRECLGGAQP